MNRTPPNHGPGSSSRSIFPDLDAAYRRQLEVLARVRRAVAAVATSRKKLELRLDQLAQDTATPESEIENVRRQLDAARDDERRVGEASERLQVKISALHSAHLAIEEAYAAAEDTAKVTLAEVLRHA
jgi:phage shock protein A